MKYKPLVVKIMRITFLQLTVILTMLGNTWARDGRAQAILNTKVSLDISNTELRTVLTKIEQAYNVNFAYSPQQFNLKQKVSVFSHLRPLSEALDELLGPLHLKYEASGDVIVIRNLKSAIPQVPGEVQQLSVTGKVVDDKSGQPLPGVTIRVKGTTLAGATTNTNGIYTISVPGKNAVLVFSFIGFEQQESLVGDHTILNIVLKEKQDALNEVIVVGYGTQKSANISGAVSTISAKKIAANPSPNLSNSLVGQTAGIIATQRSGEPGNDASNIFIRGIGTTGDATPIYVIDGIVRSQADFAQLNANEIQSLSILKDAASAAVFGIRAGNGVILVTTKRGVSGKTQIAYNANYGIQKRTRTQQFLNAFDYASLYNEALANEGKDPLYSADILQKYKDQSAPDTYPSVDWNSILKNSAMVTQHDLSATGGSDKTRYAASLSYLSQDGIVPSNNFQRYNFRSNIDADVTKTTVLSFDLSGRSEATRNLPLNNLFQLIGATPSNRYPVRFSNGNYPAGPSYSTVSENGYRKVSNGALRGRIQLVQQLPFLPGLSIKGIAAYDRTITENKSWFYPVIPFFTRLPDGTYRQEPMPNSSLTQDNYDNRSVTLETHLNYERAFGKSKIAALVLYTQTTEDWNDLSGYREKYTINIDELNFGPAANKNNGGYSGSSGRQGIVGRINFSHNDKYTLETSFRADGSEQFAQGKRWGFFPSVSAAYIISQESFFKSVKFVDYLKLRGSYGVLGNDRIGSARFLYLQSYNVSGNAVFGDGNVQQSIVEGTLANPNVTWETIKKMDFGFDATFFNGKLTTTFDYFYDRRSNILGYRSASVPALVGIGLPVENLAKVNNHGIEISLGHSGNVNNNLKYSMNANLTFARNKVVFIDEAAGVNANLLRTGRPLGTEFGFQAIGLFQSQAEVDAAPKQIGHTGPGDIRYKDVNNDGKIDDNDRVPIGRSNTPEIIYGYNGTVSYKNFELSFLLQGATNVNQWYRGEGAWPFFVGAGAMKSNLDRWTPSNPNASEPRVLIDIDNMNHSDNSSFWLKDASYLKLKNVELAYNFPKSVLGSKFMQGLRIYVNCNNVYTWTKIKNYDPENGNDRGWAYPQLQIFNAGVNVRF